MIIVVGNQKGGVGKSTLTVNLAVAWQQSGKSVVIVEADPSVFTVSTWADDREEASLPPILTVKKTGKLKEALRNLDQQYEVVLVDLPGKDSPEMRSALLAADLFLIPSQPTQADIDATINLAPIVEAVGEYNEDMKTAVVINRLTTHARSTELAEATEALEQAFETILPDAVHDRKAFRSSLSEGKSVLEGADQKAAMEIQKLAHNIEKELNYGSN
ncbi:AAA family ATPase [Corynebacterium glutamicum]|uniref:AAA family ATPase n=1 Tax=Corynebacterium glutamicum TaxID=1718 RepID=UPI000771EFF8|nr:AAA family ATPase [Corynebacterium glutamicum]AMK79454.1 hypothetical protein APT58_15280 [Corynebacterium glutamicum]